MKVSLRDRLRDAVLVVESLKEMYAIECDKSATLETLLANHHGAEKVTEEQVHLCVTCSPLLHK